MKTHILFPICLFFLGLTTLQAQAPSKTFVKSFNLKGHDVVMLDLEQSVTVKTWSSPIMRIQVEIELENGTSSMLKSLARAGRYHILSKPVDGEFLVYVPGLDKEVKVGGQILQEKIHYTVFAPEDVLVKQTGEANADAGAENSADSQLSSLR